MLKGVEDEKRHSLCEQKIMKMWSEKVTFFYFNNSSKNIQMSSKRSKINTSKQFAVHWVIKKMKRY